MTPPEDPAVTTRGYGCWPYRFGGGAEAPPCDGAVLIRLTETGRMSNGKISHRRVRDQKKTVAVDSNYGPARSGGQLGDPQDVAVSPCSGGAGGRWLDPRDSTGRTPAAVDTTSPGAGDGMARRRFFWLFLTGSPWAGTDTRNFGVTTSSGDDKGWAPNLRPPRHHLAR